MRVIAGSARRLPLKTPEGIDTRPTTDRIKETLFNILSPNLYDCRFLDLFAGSGGIGIEALSRGAAEAVFVDNSAKAAACIKENLKFTRLEERAVFLRMDVLSALSRLEGEKSFDYIFMDPPYGKELERKTLEYLAGSELLTEEGLVIAEAAKQTSFDYARKIGWNIVREKVYKTNKHVFLRPAGRKAV